MHWDDDRCLVPACLSCTAAAFGALYDELGPSADAVFSNVTTITGILLEHVLPLVANSTQLRNGTTWPTALGTFLNVRALRPARSLLPACGLWRAPPPGRPQGSALAPHASCGCR